MALPERFVIHMTGDVSRCRTRHIITPNGLPHLLSHLMSGGDVPDTAWAAFGLRVDVEVDTDMGPEG